MSWDISFEGTVEKFPGESGWFYVSVPGKYSESLKIDRKTWGRYPITANVGKTSWKTKLMIKKGGNFL